MSSRSEFRYLMENNEESLRLDLKTDLKIVEEQAAWAGRRPGMRVLDVGCGIGKTTAGLYDLVQPGGTAIGIDSSEERIRYAETLRANEELQFVCRDFTLPLDDLGEFDLSGSFCAGVLQGRGTIDSRACGNGPEAGRHPLSHRPRLQLHEPFRHAGAGLRRRLGRR